MISHWLVLVCILAWRIDGLQMEDGSSSLSLDESYEYDYDAIESDVEDYDASDDLEEVEQEVAEMMERQVYNYGYKPGYVNQMVCFGPRMCFRVTSNTRNRFQYCMAVVKGKCYLRYSDIPVKFNPSKCERFRNISGRYYVRYCKVRIGGRLRNRRQACRKIRTLRNRNQLCLQKYP